MRDAEQIVKAYLERRASRAPVFQRMDEVRRAYNGDMSIPLPDLDREEKAAVANLVQQGIDQTAMRCGSVMPGLQFYPLRPGIKASEKRARVRRDATLGWWKRNAQDLKLRRRARFMLGYGTSPSLIKPKSGADDRGQSRVLPCTYAMNPLSAYPAECPDPDELVPEDCIFAYVRGRAWLEANYPNEYRALKKNDATRAFTILEYVDGEQITCLAVGDKDESYGASDTSEKWQVLHSIRNRAERSLVVAPGRITLDRLFGQFDGMLGMLQMQGKLMALNLIGTERSIFGETWLVVNQSGTGTNAIVQAADAKDGTIGIVEGASIQNFQPGPGPYPAQALAQLDNAMRQTGPVPTEFGGRGSVNTRTGRRGEQVLSEAVDFHIQEIQVLLQRSLEEEVRISVATTKKYESRPVCFYTPRGSIDYTPEHFESDAVEVKYAYEGADLNGMVIQAGQMVGMEVFSRESFMEMHPMVKDVEQEKDRITSEALEKALLTLMQTKAADPMGELTVGDIAKVAMLVKSDKLEVAEAWEKAHQDAQKAQAALPQPGTPEAMPGLEAAQGARPELMAPAAGAGGPGLENVANLMTRLRRPAMALGGEGPPPQAAAI